MQIETQKLVNSVGILTTQLVQESQGLETIKEGITAGITDGSPSNTDKLGLDWESLIEVPIQSNTEVSKTRTNSQKRVPRINKQRRQITGQPIEEGNQTFIKRKREGGDLLEDGNRIHKLQKSSNIDDSLDYPMKVVTLDSSQGHEQQ